jgi:peptidoglycan/xylan/chitin deacetylase (PgdA/CDA1 family)
MLIELATTTALTYAGTVYAAPLLLRKWKVRQLARQCRETGTLVLTYDDGPGMSLTPQLLGLLSKHDAPATFFFAGARAKNHPDVVDQVADAGHEIGCHSLAHLNAWHHPPWRSLADIRAGYAQLERWIAPSAIYRPPCGKLDMVGWLALQARGAALGWWTIVAGDVNDKLGDPMLAAHLAQRSNGGVVLLHDFDRGPEREAFVLETTRHLLEAARARNWTIKTLSGLMKDESRRAA